MSVEQRYQAVLMVGSEAEVASTTTNPEFVNEHPEPLLRRRSLDIGWKGPRIEQEQALLTGRALGRSHNRNRLLFDVFER